jgi:hypothetical protein
VWHTSWMAIWKQLYKGLTRPESTLLRTEAIGLNTFFSRIGISGVSPSCSYGTQNEIPKHVIIFCPNRATNRAEMMLGAGTTNYHELPTTGKGLQAVTKWFLRYGELAQFTWARAEALRVSRGREMARAGNSLVGVRAEPQSVVVRRLSLSLYRLKWSKRPSRHKEGQNR